MVESAPLHRVCMVLTPARSACGVLRFACLRADRLWCARHPDRARRLHAIAARKRDRLERATSSPSRPRLGRPCRLAELGRRLSMVEGRSIRHRPCLGDRAAARRRDRELSTLVKQLADSVAAHDACGEPGRANPAFAEERGSERPRPMGISRRRPHDAGGPLARLPQPSLPRRPRRPRSNADPCFRRDGSRRHHRLLWDAIASSRSSFICSDRDAPQRKVRYYERCRGSRPKGGIVAAADFCLTPRRRSLAEARQPVGAALRQVCAGSC